MKKGKKIVKVLKIKKGGIEILFKIDNEKQLLELKDKLQRSFK